jgi:hypothetical protein
VVDHWAEWAILCALKSYVELSIGDGQLVAKQCHQPRFSDTGLATDDYRLTGSSRHKFPMIKQKAQFAVVTDAVNKSGAFCRKLRGSRRAKD